MGFEGCCTQISCVSHIVISYKLCIYPVVYIYIHIIIYINLISTPFSISPFHHPSNSGTFGKSSRDQKGRALKPDTRKMLPRSWRSNSKSPKKYKITDWREPQLKQKMDLFQQWKEWMCFIKTLKSIHFPVCAFRSSEKSGENSGVPNTTNRSVRWSNLQINSWDAEEAWHYLSKLINGHYIRRQ